MSTLIHNLINSFNNADDRILYFRSLSNKYKSLILNSLDQRHLLELLNNLNDAEIIEILKFLDPDEITDIIQSLPKKRHKKILSKFNKNYKEKINFLLKFASNSAAGLMSLNYMIVSDKDSKKNILRRLEKHILSGKKEPTILVIDDINNIFLGEIRISNLLFNKKNDIFFNLKQLPVVTYNQDQEDVIDIFRKNRHEKIVVLGEDKSILGIIHARDVFKVIEQEDTEDYYGLAGLDKQEDISDNAFEKVKFRLGWLIVNLGTAFLAAWVVTLFEDTISKYVLLAAFMPIIAGMGGNAGTQTTAILIRSLALKKIERNIIRKILFSEILASIINGIIIGIIIALIAYIFNADFRFAIIAAIAVIANLIIASLSGIIIPLLIKTLNLDPASASTVFVTTATDVCGFFIFLGLAKLFLI